MSGRGEYGDELPGSGSTELVNPPLCRPTYYLLTVSKHIAED
jgi:hypothetical protein